MADTLTVTRDTPRPGYPERGTREEPPLKDRMGAASSWTPFLVMLGVVAAIFTFWRIYQGMFAWTKGLDAASPEYGTYWMRFLYFNTGALVLLASALMAWAVKDCRTCEAQRHAHGRVDRRHEEHHIWVLWSMLAIYCLGLYAAGSFFGEQDASWHQVAIRDTAFTPSHIIEFYGVFPIFGFMSAVAFLYARKHLPAIYGDPSKGFPISWALILSSSSFLMFWVAANEWSHSFWITEEIFSAPLHWGFITFGFLAAGTFAVWFQTLPRVMELQKEEQEELGIAPVAVDVRG